jgi:hypothetical protein
MASTPSRRSRLVPWLIALGLLLVTGTVVEKWSAQPASRYLLTVAAVDDHSLELDAYEDLLIIDRAEYRGHTYSDKAPYQPLLVAPAYQLYRAVGGDPFPTTDGTRDVVPDGRFTGLWWVTLWSSLVPGIVLTLVVRRTVAQAYPRVATPVAIAMTVSTTVLPFTSWLFGHVLAAMWVALAWHLLRPAVPSVRLTVAAGLCLGMGIGTEYAVAAIAAVFLIDVVLSRDLRRILALSAGTVVATLPMLVYNWLVFENPFETSYQGHLPNFQGEGALGVYNLELPRGSEVVKLFVGDRGMFVLTPVLLLAVIGGVLLIERGAVRRRDGLVGLTCLAVMVLISTGIDGYGGGSPGPRYLIPTLPLLAVPLAEVWRRFPLVAALAAAFGAACMWLAAVTEPLIDTDSKGAMSLWVELFFDGDVTANVVTGGHNVWVFIATGAAAVALFVAATRLDRASVPAGDAQHIQ